MTQVAHDMIMVYLGFHYGTSAAEIEKLETKLSVLAEDYKKKRDELKLYKERFGQIYP